MTRNYYVYPSELQKLLVTYGITDQDAAKLCCRDIRTIHDWRQGKKPIPRWVFRLLNYWGVEPEWAIRRRLAYKQRINLMAWWPDKAANDAQIAVSLEVGFDLEVCHALA